MELTPIALWLNTACAGLDESVAIAVHKLYEIAPGFFTPFLAFITLLGKGGIFLILMSFALMLFRPTRRYGTTILLAITFGALITNVIVKPLVARPRPYTWDDSVFQQFWFQLGKYAESDKSFPSGHMTAAMAASTAVYLRGPRKVSWTAFLFAFLMGVSRIYLGVHYFTDVLAAVVTGGLGGVLGYHVSLRIPEQFYEGDAKNLLPGYRQEGRHQTVPEEKKDREVRIDGADFSDLRGFYAAFSKAWGLGEDEYVRNMDAYNDLLRGGFTDGDAGTFTVFWVNSEKSRQDLGYEATAAFYERMLRRATDKNREKIEKRIADAREEKGDTLFDMLTRLIIRSEEGALKLD